MHQESCFLDILLFLLSLQAFLMLKPDVPLWYTAVFNRDLNSQLIHLFN